MQLDITSTTVVAQNIIFTKKKNKYHAYMKVNTSEIKLLQAMFGMI